MFEFLAFVLVPVLSLALVVKLDAMADDHDDAGLIGRRMRWPALGAFLHRLRPWHAVVSIALTGLIYAMMVSSPPELPLLLAAGIVMALFYRAWRHEFVALMACPDDVFPGRHDKLVWSAMMILLPPLGFSCFRNYRGANRPEAVVDPHAKPAPIHDLV
jgi:hypothetical protein